MEGVRQQSDAAEDDAPHGLQGGQDEVDEAPSQRDASAARSSSIRSTSLDDGKHALERHEGALLYGVRDHDLVRVFSGLEALKDVEEVGGVNHVHRGAWAHLRVQAFDVLVWMFLRHPRDHVDLGPHRNAGTGGLSVDEALDVLG